MCEPMTIMAAASMAMGMISAKQKADSEQSQLDYQGAVARSNQAISEASAKEIEVSGTEEANQYRAQVRSAEANQIVSLVAQGGDVTEGSAIDLLSDTAEHGEMEAQKIKNNRDREAYQMRLRGMGFANEANLKSMASGAISPGFEVASAGVSGAGNVVGAWKAWKAAEAASTKTTKTTKTTNQYRNLNGKGTW